MQLCRRAFSRAPLFNPATPCVLKLDWDSHIHIANACMQAEQRGVFQLMSQCLFDNDFLNYRPSVVAAGVLYAQRRASGQLPFWPSVLATLTAYSPAHTPELNAAIAGATRSACLPPASKP